jgi:hypothetical protein
MLVLHETIQLGHYPRILATPCRGCQVTHVGRAGANLVSSAFTTLQPSASKRHHSKLVMATGRDGASQDAGGALFERDGHLVALMVGRGSVSGQRYAIPVTDHVAQEWMRTAIAATTMTPPIPTSTSVKSKSLHVLDEDVGGDDGSGGGGGDDDTGGGGGFGSGGGNDDTGSNVGDDDSQASDGTGDDSPAGLGNGNEGDSVDGFVDDSAAQAAEEQSAFDNGALPGGDTEDGPLAGAADNGPADEADPSGDDDDATGAQATGGDEADDVVGGGTPDVDPTADPPTAPPADPATAPNDSSCGGQGQMRAANSCPATPGANDSMTLSDGHGGTIQQWLNGAVIKRDKDGNVTAYTGPPVSASMTPEQVKANEEWWSQVRIDNGLNTVGPDGKEYQPNWAWANGDAGVQMFGAKHDVQAAQAQWQAMQGKDGPEKQKRLDDYAAANFWSAAEGAYVARKDPDAGLRTAQAVFKKYGFDVSPAKDINVRPPAPGSPGAAQKAPAQPSFTSPGGGA